MSSKAVELFVGAGGLGMGISLANFRTVMAIEIDKWACDTVRLNQRRGLAAMADWTLVEKDVRDINYSTIEDTIDLVAGGPPCQPFSMGGRHAGHLDPRDMFPEAIRAVRELRPKAFLFENVKGLARAAFSDYLAYIVKGLSEPQVAARPDESWTDHLSRLTVESIANSNKLESYDVSYTVLNAADFGVPQRRERLFIVGVRRDLGTTWNFPQPTHSRDALLWDQWQSGKYWQRHNLHPPQNGDWKRERARVARLKKEDILKGRPWVTVRDVLEDLPDPELHPESASTHHDHAHIPGARSYKGHTGSPWDMPAKTLKAGVHGVPGGENMLRREDGSVRYFTVRESARLQTFPDDIHFHGSWGQVMRQLGNAVPSELARVLGTHLKKTVIDRK